MGTEGGGREGVRGGGSCLGGTSSGAEVSDSPTELRQRTRKRNAWSLRTPRRFELTFEIQGRYRGDIGKIHLKRLELTFLPLTYAAPRCHTEWARQPSTTVSDASSHSAMLGEHSRVHSKISSPVRYTGDIGEIYGRYTGDLREI